MITIPLTLLKYRKQYLFDEAGRYTLRVVLRVPARVGGQSFIVEATSGEVDIDVEAGCGDFEAYLRSHRAITVLRAFSIGEWYKDIYHSQYDYGCYCEEQMKLLSLQCGGTSIRDMVLLGEKRGDDFDAWYGRGVELSAQIGMAAEVWAWIGDVDSGRAAVIRDGRTARISSGMVF
jgi:hypothetical protein